MPVVKAPLHTAMPPTVHVLKPHKSIVLPPADWALDGKFGHMAFEASDAGRLVRLAEVLRWLQSSRGLPRTDALKLLCDGLNAEVMGWLYWLQETTWAVPVSPIHTFGFMTTEQIAASEERSRQQQYQAWLRQQRQNNSFGTSFNRFGAALTVQNGRISTKRSEPVEPGLPALLKYLRGYWGQSQLRGATCDALDDKRIPNATLLAIRLDKAYELWRYGRIVATVNDNELKQAEPPDSWSVHSPVGLLRCGPLPADRLVRLVDVVQWFVTDRETPRLSAVQRVCDVINADALGWLYHVNEGTYAVAPDTSSGFIAFLPGTGTNAEKVAYSFATQIQAVCGNGNWPGGVLAANEHPCAALACTINRAYELWDYGTVVNAPLLAETQPASKEWSGEMLAAQLAVFKADGKPAHMKRLATLSGLNDRKIRHLIAGVKTPKTDVKLDTVWVGRAIKNR
jgi:hypothetical protein